VQGLPTGTVTFLFTDVEGSTRLLAELGDAYADVLGEHRRALRQVFERHGGVEVDTQGDAFFVAFARARDAVAAAEDAQEALQAGPVRVRMGVHTGEPVVTDEGYAGMDVHRAARIAAVGHGGQVLVSQSTRDLVPDVHLRDLGAHRLKDLTAPERIYQLGDAEFPPLRSLDRTNLPIAATPLVGRQQELAELIDLLRAGARLVTLTGAGGSGKTRLALQAAAELAHDFEDGVVFVPLAPLDDAALVTSSIAQHAGLRDLDDLRRLELLLVLDNLEHLLKAVDDIGSLLTTAPGVTLLVTSRTRLHVSAEHEFELEPFPPDEAVDFFLVRAGTVKRGLKPDAAVTEICRRLDGLPLALELAASRVKLLEPARLLERLDRSLPVLTGGARDAPERQQTLAATIEWSYELLNAPSQEVFRDLSVFAGSFALEDAESVAQAGLDELATLVDWSLLKPTGDGRFFMLATIREYAGELLRASGAFEAVSGRHLDRFLDLVAEAEPRLTGPEQREWFDRLALEQENIRAALGYACDAGDGERALALAGNHWRYWYVRATIDEADHWYRRAFAAGGQVSEPIRARAVFGWAHVPEARGEPAQTRAQFQEAADLFRALGETRWLVLALTHLASAEAALGDPAAGRRLNEEALALAEESGDRRNAGLVRGNLAWHAFYEGDYERAYELTVRALEDSRAAGDIVGIASRLDALAELARHSGDLHEARGFASEALELHASVGHVQGIAWTLVLAAAVVPEGGDRTAAVLLACAAELRRTHGFELNDDRPFVDELTESIGRRLGHERDEAWAEGAALEPSAVVALALSALGE
jgi:predicted ATPase/class 3 adenylate cyclase